MARTFVKHETGKKALHGVCFETMVTIQKQLTVEVYVTFTCIENLSMNYIVRY